MREILFRGKRIDNGEWVYGTYLHQTLFYGDPVDDHWIIEHGEFDIDFYDAYRVISETVGQYTNLTDKNGTKIFEGDIITTKKFGTPDRKYVVTYDEEIATFIGETRLGCVNHFTTFQGDSEEFEVVGNIHDNPDLLKGGIKQ